MEESPLQVWFFCKDCSEWFEQVSDYIVHKKEEHFDEFQKSSCIVFEETTSHQDEDLPVQVLFKEEPEDEDENLLDNDSQEPLSYTDDPNSDETDNYLFRLTHESETKIEEDSTFKVSTDADADADADTDLANNDDAEVVLPDFSTFEGSANKIRAKKYKAKKSVKKEVQNSSITGSYGDGGPNLISKSTNKQKVGVRVDASVKFTAKETASERYCGTCNKLFVNNASFKSHAFRFHASKDERARASFKCQVCQSPFISKSELSLHEKRNHSDVRAYKCNQPNCERAFKLKSDLARHINSHFDVRPFPCVHPGCNKSFTRKFHLNAHLQSQIHNNK